MHNELMNAPGANVPMPSLRPDYTKTNVLKKIRGKMMPRDYIRALSTIYKEVIHDLDLLKETKFITEKEYEDEITWFKDRFVEYALKCDE